MPKMTIFEVCSSMAAGIAITIGALVFAGWLCHMPMLVQPGAGMATMKANTAFCIVFCGISITSLLRFQRTQRQNWALLTGLTAIISGLIAIATLCEYAGWNIGIDQIFALDIENQQGTFSPGRMGLNTAICFCALNLGLFFSSLNKRIFYSIAVALAFTAFAISVFSIIGYIYGVSVLYRISTFTNMALATATAFILLSIGLLCALPQYSPVCILSDSTSGGFIARRLVPLALLMPPLLGWVLLEAQRMGVFPTEFGLAIMVLLMMFFMTLSMFWISGAVARKDMTLEFANELEKTTNRLTLSNTELAQFYAILVHELRTPLTSMRGSLQLLVNGRGKGRETALMNISLNETERMLLLINELLDLKKIEEGKFDFNLTDTQPGEIVSKALNALQGMAFESKVILSQTVTGTKLIYCDENKIIQTLANLISNAMKFAPADSQVNVVVAETELGTRFSVVDCGPGIPVDQLPKLFQKFQQLDAKNEVYKGTGLGLSISKSIVEQHGGKIGVDSTPGQGATFWFELPDAKAWS